jgi:hypothetical protein
MHRIHRVAQGLLHHLALLCVEPCTHTRDATRHTGQQRRGPWTQRPPRHPRTTLHSCAIKKGSDAQRQRGDAPDTPTHGTAHTTEAHTAPPWVTAGRPSTTMQRRDANTPRHTMGAAAQARHTAAAACRASRAAGQIVLVATPRWRGHAGDDSAVPGSDSAPLGYVNSR